jgi:hypothetical protein
MAMLGLGRDTGNPALSNLASTSAYQLRLQGKKAVVDATCKLTILFRKIKINE